MASQSVPNWPSRAGKPCLVDDQTITRCDIYCGPDGRNCRMHRSSTRGGTSATEDISSGVLRIIRGMRKLLGL
jgi:hypothetical protein